MSYFDEDWAPRFDFGGPRPTTALKRIVIHTTENAAGTPASNVANYQLTSQTGSYHMLVDTTGHRLRENTDAWITWSTGNDQGNVEGLNLSFVFYSASTRAQWLAQEKMLRAAATVAAHWATTYNIPVVKTDGTTRGFCGHGDLRRYGGTDHTDPGASFPWDVFLDYVRQAQDGATKVSPAPRVLAPSTQREKEGVFMALSDRRQEELAQKIDRIHFELTERFGSRYPESTFRDTLVGYVLEMDRKIEDIHRNNLPAIWNKVRGLLQAREVVGESTAEHGTPDKGEVTDAK